MSEAVCAIHHVLEVPTPDSYRECGECWHVYQTQEELQAESDALAALFNEPTWDAETVFSCPLCGHDW